MCSLVHAIENDTGFTLGAAAESLVKWRGHTYYTVANNLHTTSLTADVATTSLLATVT